MPSSGGGSSGGFGFLGSFDTSGFWGFTDESGVQVTQPPPVVLCPAVREQWQQQECAGVPIRIEPNGCGTGFLMSLVVPQSFIGGGSADFTASCNGHDNCYTSPLADRYVCDGALQTAMAADCNAKPPWDAWLSQATEQGIFGTARHQFAVEERQQCIGQSLIYHGAVALFGLPAFEEGQKGAVCRALRDLSNSASCSL